MIHTGVETHSIKRKINGSEADIKLTEKEMEEIYEVMKTEHTIRRISEVIESYYDEEVALEIMATEYNDPEFFEAFIKAYEDYEDKTLLSLIEANIKAAISDAEEAMINPIQDTVESDLGERIFNEIPIFDV